MTAVALKPVYQTLFGGPRTWQVGNCYPACLATILGIDLVDVPHFYMLHPRDDEAAAQAVLDWLQARDFTIFTFDYLPWVHRFLPGAVVIVSGKSPRGDFLHAVVGRIERDGWTLLHDPREGGVGGIVGEPKSIEVIVPLLRCDR